MKYITNGLFCFLCSLTCIVQANAATRDHVFEVPTFSADTVSVRLYSGSQSGIYTYDTEITDIKIVNNKLYFTLPSFTENTKTYIAIKTRNPAGQLSAEFSNEILVHDASTNLFPTFYKDFNNDGLQDILFIGSDGVYISYGRKDQITSPAVSKKVVDFFSPAQDWDPAKNPIGVADINRDGLLDIYGFGGYGLRVAYAKTADTYEPAVLVFNEQFGYEHGWRIEKHPRFLQDINKDGFLDICGFGDNGLRVALSINGTSFAPSTLIYSGNFGYANGWRVEKHVRLLVDLNNDGLLDIVGFSDYGIRAAYAKSTTSFYESTLIFTEQFGYEHGWRVENHLRYIKDVNADGIPDICGFGDKGLRIAYGINDMTYHPSELVIDGDFGYSQGWLPNNFRDLQDLNGDGIIDILAAKNGQISIMAGE